MMEERMRKRTRSYGPPKAHVNFWAYRSQGRKRIRWAPGDPSTLVVEFGRGIVGYFRIRNR